MMKQRTMLLVVCAVLVSAVVSAGQPMEPYQTAIARFIAPYSHGTLAITVTVGENEPASYTMEIWTKGRDVSASVIIDASASFMLGLAFLEAGDQVTAWWPSLKVEKTFAISQTEEEVGFGMGRLDQIIWHSDDYEPAFLKETATELEYRVTPKEDVNSDFSYGIVTVEKGKNTLSRAEFWSDADELIEIDTVERYKEFTTETGNKILYPESFTVEDPTADKRTAMRYTKLEFPASIPDEVFTLDFLKEQSALLLEGRSTP